MSVLQLNLQLSNMECIQMNLKLCFTSLFSVICTLLAKMAKKFQIIMSAYVNIIQTQSEELRLQAALKAQFPWLKERWCSILSLRIKYVKMGMSVISFV